ncbi:MAG: DUF4982 domain-containing protein, partial [Lachnospiraceae bacterium]|nr:DUF4982 domain-containing protein [Lachnospiraceae bacterium]
PYWDFNPGQMIDVRVCSNEDTVELFVNGESKGKQTLTHKPGSGTHLIAEYRIPYEPGTIEAVSYDKAGNITAKETRHSFGDAASIVITADNKVMRASSDDLIFAEISVTDAEGHPVENASDRIRVEVSGAGRLVGLDNGDSTDTDSYKGMSRRLFNGKLLAIIAPKAEAGDVFISASANGLKSAQITLDCITGETPGAIDDSSPFDTGVTDVFEENTERPLNLGSENDVPVRKIEISCEDRVFTPERKEIPVSIKILPDNATDREIIRAVVNDKGVPTNIAEVFPNGPGAVLRAKGDGEFRLRCMSKSGTDNIRVISETEFRIEGIGRATLDPYDFIYGSIYSYSEGDVGAGNEMGFSTAREERCLVAFENVDFGKAGSDEITIPVFALDDSKYSIRVYDGIPSQGGKLIGDLTYSKPMIWNVYQEDTWKLDTTLKGIHTICLEFDDKVHVKGFSFKKCDRAFMEISASDADEIYGDSFSVNGGDIENIGNNVSIEFKEMDFSDKGTGSITICGKAPKPNTIHIRFSGDGEEIRNVIEFDACDEYACRTFEFDKITGMKDVAFVFMPGSDFDMRSFRFGY